MTYKSLITAAAIALVSIPAMAKDITNVSPTDPETVVAALGQLGYPGKLDKLESGRSSITVQISGLKTFVDFYDCDDNMSNCDTLLFTVSVDLKDGTTMSLANEWNSKQITGRVWLDNDSDPTLDFSLTAADGVPIEVFEQNVKLWDKKIGDFKDFFKF